jgi:hypothetical protein
VCLDSNRCVELTILSRVDEHGVVSSKPAAAALLREGVHDLMTLVSDMGVPGRTLPYFMCHIHLSLLTILQHHPSVAQSK